MKRFSFRLEQVRKWRSGQAELEEIRLEQLYAERSAIGRQQTELANAAAESRRRIITQTSVRSEELASLEAFDDYAKHELRRLQAKKQDVETRIAAQRVRVVEAHRNFQLLDGLRDKALLAWSSAHDKEQEDLAAELYLGQLARGRKTR